MAKKRAKPAPTPASNARPWLKHLWLVAAVATFALAYALKSLA
ncbi:MAG: hypothetical protein U0547_10255 [Dehalococcoidia bacterium]